MKPSRKPRKCANKACRKDFTPTRPLQKVCHWQCALVIAEEQRIRKEKLEAKRARAEHRTAKEKVKRRNEHQAEAQAAFNAFIRERDWDQPCISCGVTNPPMLHGGQWDAGHFISVGAHPELRFEESNCHRQCKSCNGGSKYPGKARTVSANYEPRLLAKIGQAQVDWLKGPHEPKKYTIEDFVAIKALYRAKKRGLAKARESGGHHGGHTEAA